ncbi:cupredoxin family copper-binding protein [Longimicrobium sp.]|uniref:cupredoxin domain-containing protein n=1 Tax=Longimicrobium sp. TaxID=2029185 RepID=UPI002E354399|nr:cupredoxin family copper-binding protein [Longimicrobium sp.]HEX6036721.1 cupredoxin family copper-binding protein [Longimicrobium sp.]
MNLRAAYSFSCAAFALAVATGSLAGCFSERVAGSNPPAGDLCEGTPANVIQIRNFAFVQQSLQVSPGTTVTFVNCDTETHTSTSDAGVWDSGALTPGSTFQRTFNAAGSFPFHCTPHPSMKGTVVVG